MRKDVVVFIGIVGLSAVAATVSHFADNILLREAFAGLMESTLVLGGAYFVSVYVWKALRKPKQTTAHSPI